MKVLDLFVKKGKVILCLAVPNLEFFTTSICSLEQFFRFFLLSKPAPILPEVPTSGFSLWLFPDGDVHKDGSWMEAGAIPGEQVYVAVTWKDAKGQSSGCQS